MRVDGPGDRGEATAAEPAKLGPQLSSLSTALTELTSRLSALAESIGRTATDEVANALFEVERSLIAAGRRLDKVVDDVGAAEAEPSRRRRH